MNMFRVLALSIGLSVCASATTIVAIWTPAKLVIVADSIITLVSTSADGHQKSRTEKDCKIRKIGKNYFSAAGILHVKSVRFDIWDSASRACASSSSLDICSAKLKPELQTALGRVVKQNRANRRSGRPLHEVRLTVLVAGNQDGAPAMDHITFLATPDDRVTVKSESFRKSKSAAEGRVILGDRGAIDRFEKTHSANPGDSPEEEALALVKIEARAAPKDVGPPFSTLVIDAEGDRWPDPGCCGQDGCKGK